ncbi:MAG: c-type cytochrome [Azonexus sp.]
MDRFFAGIALAAAVTAPAQAVALAKAETIVAERCSLCHGMKGESVSAVFPRLAGQHSEYIAKQLAEFKSGRRKSDTMQPQAENLTPEEMKALGQYFESKQVGGRQVRDAELLAVGKYIFQRGNPFSGLPACASCHGENGHGTPQLPRLAGQHPRYTEDQIKQFNTRERNNDNAVMHTVASKLTELETHAVAAYIATLD